MDYNRHRAGSEKVTDTASRNLDLRGSGFRAHGERDDLLADTLSFPQAGIFERQVAMFPHRFRPVDERFDSLFVQILAELVTPLRANDIVLITVEIFIAGKMGQMQAFDSFQVFAIQSGRLSPMFDPARKMAQLGVENRSLNVIQQCSAAVVMKFSGLPVFAV